MLLYIALTILLMVLSSAITAMQIENRPAIIPEAIPEAPAAEPMPEEIPEAAALADDDSHDTPEEHSESWPYVGNNRFAGHCVTFTGTLDMGREAAAEAVRKNGGKVFDTITDDVDMIVIGNSADVSTMVEVTRRNIKRMYEWQFDIEIKMPLSLTL